MKRGPSITGCLPLSDPLLLPSIKWRYDITVTWKLPSSKVGSTHSTVCLASQVQNLSKSSRLQSKASTAIGSGLFVTIRTKFPCSPFFPSFSLHISIRGERISRLWHYCRVSAICKLASTVSCLLTASRQLRCTTSPSYITNILAKLPYCNFWWKTLGCFTQLGHSAGHCSHVLPCHIPRPYLKERGKAQGSPQDLGLRLLNHIYRPTEAKLATSKAYFFSTILSNN